ncbi:MAG TPA: hypothetical protein VJ397_02085 [Thermoplasmata archaeon]|nr:hypothetical protein [Thermoplasmata archaeon]
MTETAQAVLQHLLWHKALAADHEDGGRIDQYVAMLGEIDQGLHVALSDPFEKAIAAAFALVLENRMDPWDLNLAQFTRMFLERMSRDGGVNFLTAGKLVAMAWEILRKQTEDVLEHSKPPQEFVESLFEDWDVGGILAPPAPRVDFSEAVLQGKVVPLHEAVRREGHRSVSLLELMNAFQEAKVEAERQLEINAMREKARSALRTTMHDKLHGEDLSEDIGLTWGRILRFNGDAIPLNSLWAPEPWDRITVFVSVLFLVKFGRLKAWQEDFPRGEIFVQRVDDAAPPEPLSQVPAVAAGVA